MTERPRERLLRHGANTLSTAELIAIVLRSGTQQRSALGLAEQLLSEHGGLRGIACSSVEQLQSIKGIGVAKSVEIAACVELGKRLASHFDDLRPIIRTPEDAAHMLVPELRYANKEMFKAILLDTKSRALRTVTISVGSLDQSMVHPRELFKEAVAASAASLIIAHNHPSGDPSPSPEDLRVTERVVESGKLLGIEVMDHVIIGNGKWVSLKRQGLM